MKVVIVGNHAAGLSAAEMLRKGDESCQITVISKEDVPPYSRCLIGYIVAGKKDVDGILARPRSFYEENSIDTMFGVTVDKILPAEKAVVVGSGDKINYDALILANGGSPRMPKTPGVDNKGVFQFRDLQDANKIIEYCEEGVEDAVVFGGGLVGLKAAEGLHRRGKNVKVIVSSPNVLSQIVASTEAVLFEDQLRAKGIEIITETSIAKILGEGKVEGVETTEGEKIKCELVVIGKGVRANMNIVEGTDIEKQYGIIVDDNCRTSVDDIYAAGDVTQSIDSVRGERWANALWPHAVEEGRIAAMTILGKEKSLEYRTQMNSFTIYDLPLISCGLVGAMEKVEGGEEIIVRSPDNLVSKRFILKDRCLVGFALVGDVNHAGTLCSLVRKGVNIETAREEILAGKYDFSTILPLIRENKDKFTEPEYAEVLNFF